MFIEIDSIKLFYEQNAGSGTPVLLLHGWGGSSKTIAPIFSSLVASGRSVVSLDLAGFGQSDEPPEHFGVFDYADLVKKFLVAINIDSVIIAGHSFGGRIAIILAANNSFVQKIVLIDSAGMKPRRKLSYYIKVFRYKRAKKRGKNLENYGSDDFRALGGVMQRVFTRVVNQHLDDHLQKIACPSLIIFGKNDKDTPLYMAKRLNRGIRDSGLIVLEDAGHYSYLDQPAKFNAIIQEFIREGQ